MKCKLTRELELSIKTPGFRRDVFTFPGDTRIDDRGREYAPVGTIIDHPDCWKLVANLDAEAADDECAERVKIFWMRSRTKTELILAKRRLDAGIHPDDWDAFDAGEMVGYDPETGEQIPGPMAHDDEDDD